MKKVTLLTLLCLIISCLDMQAQVERFYYRFKGGESWEGNSLAQRTATRYLTIRVGEYHWMRDNFNAWDPFTGNPFYKTTYGAFTDRTMANYFRTMDAKNPAGWNDLYNVEIDNVNFDYGYYFDSDGAYKLNLWGNFSSDPAGLNRNHPNGAGTFQQQYRLPYYEDVRQLFAMSPFNDPNARGERIALNERDIRFTIGAARYANSSAFNFYEDAITNSNWFIPNSGNFLNFMPAGWRSCIANDTFENGTPNPKRADGKWDMALGDIAQMFFVLRIPVANATDPWRPVGLVDLAENVNSTPDLDYLKHPKRVPIRWMRALTDAELGYKLYIKITGIENTTQWASLRDKKDEIPLLKAFRSKVIDLSKVTVDIQKLPHTSPAPAGYIVLPKGYLRGFYVQYKIQTNSTRTINQIATYAANVEDNVLGYVTPKKSKSSRMENPLSPLTPSTGVKLYPNPASDFVNVTSSDPLKSVKIFDQSGRLVINNQESLQSPIDVSRLAHGAYTVKVESSKGVETLRLLKK